jgi:hypothetical protein
MGTQKGNEVCFNFADESSLIMSNFSWRESRSLSRGGDSVFHKCQCSQKGMFCAYIWITAEERITNKYMEESFFWQADNCSAGKFPCLYGTQKFVFRTVYHWILFFASWIWFKPSQPHTVAPYSFNVHFNIVIQSTAWSTKWSVSVENFRPKCCMNFLLFSCVPFAMPISSSIWRPFMA